MRVLFVTVGTSAITNERIGAVENRDNSALRDAVRRYMQDPTKSSTMYNRFQGVLVLEHLRVWTKGPPYAMDPKHFLEGAAELTSTACLMDMLAKEGLAPVKEIVLLVSETPEGELAGRVLEAVMRDPVYPAGAASVKVSMVRVPGLESGPFTLIDNLLARIRPYRGENEHAYFNLTGSYKGTAVLIGMRALKQKFRLYYQHEKSTSGVFLNDDGTPSPTPKPAWKD